MPLITYSGRAYCQLRPAYVQDLAEEAMAGVSRMGIPASVTAPQAPLYRECNGGLNFVSLCRFDRTVVPSGVRSPTYTRAFRLRDQTSAPAAMG